MVKFMLEKYVGGVKKIFRIPKEDDNTCVLMERDASTTQRIPRSEAKEPFFASEDENLFGCPETSMQSAPKASHLTNVRSFSNKFENGLFGSVSSQLTSHPRRSNLSSTSQNTPTGNPSINETVENVHLQNGEPTKCFEDGKVLTISDDVREERQKSQLEISNMELRNKILFSQKDEKTKKNVKGATQTIGDLAGEDTYESMQPDERPLPKQRKGKNDESVIQNILMSIEKIEGKLEGTTESKNQLMQKTMDLSERIGEVRSMVLERERKINDIDLTVTRVSDIVENVDPKKFLRNIEKINSKLSEFDVVMEKNDGTIKILKSEISRLNDKTSKIGDFEALSNMQARVSKSVDEVNNKRKEVFVISSKIESMFGELSARFPELDSIKTNVEEYTKILQDMLKDVDALKTQMSAIKTTQNSMKKKDVSKEPTKKDFESFNEMFSTDLKATNKRMLAISAEIQQIVKHVKRLETTNKDNAAVEFAALNRRIEMLESRVQKTNEMEDTDRNINRVLTEYEKLNNIWERDTDVAIKNINTSMGVITNKLGSVSSELGRFEEKQAQAVSFSDMVVGNQNPKTRHFLRQDIEKPSGTDDIEAAIQNTKKAIMFIDEGRHSEAGKLYSKSLETYSCAITKNDLDPAIHVQLITLYGALKRIHSRLKNENKTLKTRS